MIKEVLLWFWELWSYEVLYKRMSEEIPAPALYWFRQIGHLILIIGLDNFLIEFIWEMTNFVRTGIRKGFRRLLFLVVQRSIVPSLSIRIYFWTIFSSYPFVLDLLHLTLQMALLLSDTLLSFLVSRCWSSATTLHRNFNARLINELFDGAQLIICCSHIIIDADDDE